MDQGQHDGGPLAAAIGARADLFAYEVKSPHVHKSMSIHFPGNGAGESRPIGGAVPRIRGEGEAVMHVPSVHTWPAWHGIRHPPQLAWSLEISTHFPKQNICPLGHCRPCAFAAVWVMQRNRPIVSPASKALLLMGQTLRLYDRPALRNTEDATMPRRGEVRYWRSGVRPSVSRQVPACCPNRGFGGKP